MLSRREHSVEELRKKLLVKDWESADIDELIASLQQQGLQSDQRFAESYIRMRSNKGYGPLRIDNELRERGVAENIRRECLAQVGQDWWQLMLQVRVKKFGDAIPLEYAERAKQMRFLQYRGFAPEKIRELIS